MNEYVSKMKLTERARKTEQRVRQLDADQIVGWIHSLEDCLDKLTDMLDDMQYRVEDEEVIQDQRDIVINAVSDMMKEIADVR